MIEVDYLYLIYLPSNDFSTIKLVKNCPKFKRYISDCCTSTCLYFKGINSEKRCILCNLYEEYELPKELFEI
jgi:hypothetical protein